MVGLPREAPEWGLDDTFYDEQIEEYSKRNQKKPLYFNCCTGWSGKIKCKLIDLIPRAFDTVGNKIDNSIDLIRLLRLLKLKPCNVCWEHLFLDEIIENIKEAYSYMNKALNVDFSNQDDLEYYIGDALYHLSVILKGVKDE